MNIIDYIKKENPDVNQELSDELFQIDDDLLDSLIYIRESKNLSYQEIEELTGIDRGEIENIEKGDRDPRLSELRLYSLVLNIKIEKNIAQKINEIKSISKIKKTHVVESKYSDPDVMGLLYSVRKNKEDKKIDMIDEEGAMSIYAHIPEKKNCYLYYSNHFLSEGKGVNYVGCS